MIVLPLGHLVVAIDPNSEKTTEILHILRPISTIHCHDRCLYQWYVDGFPETAYIGWGGPRVFDANGARIKSMVRRPRFRDIQGYWRTTDVKISFFSKCLQTLFQRERDSYVDCILIDSDEFLVYNYRHPDFEDAAPVRCCWNRLCHTRSFGPSSGTGSFHCWNNYQG